MKIARVQKKLTDAALGLSELCGQMTNMEELEKVNPKAWRVYNDLWLMVSQLDKVRVELYGVHACPTCRFISNIRWDEESEKQHCHRCDTLFY